MISNVEIASTDNLLLIYFKNYLAEILLIYKFIQNQENWRIKIRPIIFNKNENDI